MDEHRTDRDSEAQDNVARHLAVERQKDELRQERDRLLVSMAATGGAEQLASSLGVAPETAARMLLAARERLGEDDSPASNKQIVARRATRRQPARVIGGSRQATEPSRSDESTLPRRRSGRIAPPRSGARERAPDGERWAEADEHFAALGRRLPD